MSRFHLQIGALGSRGVHRLLEEVKYDREVQLRGEEVD